MAPPLKSISVAGFKSIAQLYNFDLRDVNLLIGANGSGKSNFIGLFKFLHELIARRLGLYTATMGGAESFLFLGRARTPQISVSLRFGQNGYDFDLVPTVEDRFVFKREAAYFRGSIVADNYMELGSGHSEARLSERKDEPGNRGANAGIASCVWESLSSWVLYHFDNTGPEAPARLECEVNDNENLRPDASNLAAYLFRLQTASPEAYAEIRNAIRQAAPFFDDFRLRPNPLNVGRIQLEWSQSGTDYRFRAVHLSDGTLRFICLATALLDPHRPATILFDEPELGLHPAALTALAALFRQKRTHTERKQLLATTQSAPFLSEFSPEDVIVVERDENGASNLRRLEPEPLAVWLEDYSLGDLWQMNVLGGRPSPDAPLPAEARRNSG